MGRFILKITDDKAKKDYYLEWSTIVDAPVTYGGSLKQFKDYYKNKYGESGMKELPERLKRVNKTGCSSMMGDKAEDFFNCNRAGKNETQLDKEGLLDNYCRNWVGYKEEKQTKKNKIQTT